VTLKAMWPRRPVWRGVLGDVERVEAVAQRHEDAAVLGVLLGDTEPEHVAVEAFGGLLVGDPEEDVADARQLDHQNSPVPAQIEAPC